VQAWGDNVQNLTFMSQSGIEGLDLATQLETTGVHEPPRL
jgi:hypothetical protein